MLIKLKNMQKCILKYFCGEGYALILKNACLVCCDLEGSLLLSIRVVYFSFLEDPHIPYYAGKLPKASHVGNW